MNVSKQCIWANYPGEALQPDQFPLFPNADYPERNLNAGDVDLLLNSLSPLYLCAIRAASKVASERFSIPAPVYETLLRDIVVLTTYVFFDRVLRIQRLLGAGRPDRFTIAKPDRSYAPQTMLALATGCDGSQQFNQYVLSLLAAIWRIELSASRPMLENVKNAKPIKNLNFDETGLPRRALRKFTRLTSARLGKFPALSLTNVEDILLDNGLYGPGKLAWVPLAIPEEHHNPCRSLRRDIERRIRREAAKDFIEAWKLLGWKEARHVARALIVYARMLADFVPSGRLEGAAAYRYCENYLQRFAGDKLWFSGMAGEREIFWIAAAKNRGMKIVGIQHGAHYGFSSQPCHIELEYAYCDAFASWGWEVFPASPLTRHIQPLPLPSPWLSSRKKKWGKRNLKIQPAFDVLLMTDRLQPYPPSVTTLRMSRLDFLQDISKAFATLVDDLCSMHITILHKPFNYTSKEIQAAVINDLRQRHAGHYKIYEQLDKGLTDALLSQCRIVIWDEPGTGFFECLIAGIPSMVYWPRITSHEEPYARGLFAKLEEAELVHNDPHRLACSVKNFLAAPNDWKEDPARKAAIQEALYLWARTDRRWAAPWKQAVAKL